MTTACATHRNRDDPIPTHVAGPRRRREQHQQTDDTLAAVDAHCQQVADVFSALAGQYETDAPILTMGGSIFPDRVVTHMSTVTTVPKTRSIVRSGCYITHDHGIYARTSPIAGLVPAVSVRAIVLSTPEPGVAVVGAGRRELPDDAGMPVVLAAASAGHIPRAGNSATSTGCSIIMLYSEKPSTCRLRTSSTSEYLIPAQPSHAGPVTS